MVCGTAPLPCSICSSEPGTLCAGGLWLVRAWLSFAWWYSSELVHRLFIYFLSLYIGLLVQFCVARHPLNVFFLSVFHFRTSLWLRTNSIQCVFFSCRVFSSAASSEHSVSSSCTCSAAYFDEDFFLAVKPVVRHPRRYFETCPFRVLCSFECAFGRINFIASS